MTPGALPALLVLAGLLALVAGALWRSRYWLAGRPAPVNLWRGLLAVPRRYLVNVHNAVHRDPVGARRTPERGGWTSTLHVLNAGGLIAATVLILLVHGLGIGGTVLAWLLLLVLAGMAVGAVLEAARRWRPDRPARLSGGGFDRLPAALAAYVVFFGAVTLPAAGLTPAPSWTSLPGLILLVLGVFACAELYVGMARGPMKHALAGALHLAAHPRPQRFHGGQPDSALAPANLDARRLGAERTADFPWNRLLAFDACVECGRCEAVCPAFDAGLPLNPKALIQDLARSAVNTGREYHGSPHPGRAVAEAGGGRPLVAENGVIHPDTLWACTTCRACVYECPMMIEHVDAVIELRRHQTLDAGSIPAAGSDLLDELRATDTVNGHSPAQRLDWAVDLNLPRIADREGGVDVLLWLGDGAFDLRHQRVLRALVHLLRAAEVDFAVLGEAELDCGDIARRMGDDATFQDLARRNIETLGRYHFERIVTADPHALHTLRNEYPALGGHYTVLHHTALLAELMAAGRLDSAPLDGEGEALTYHDPCYLGRYNGEIDAPRRILAGLGMDYREMARSGMRSSCCGAGGGMSVIDVPGEHRIADRRMDHVRETGAGTVAVACPHCCSMLEGVTQPRPAVSDVAELLWRGVEARRG